MKLICRKCGHRFDPSRESAACTAAGHMPVVDCDQRLPSALTHTREEKKQRKQFQSDFAYIWIEPNANAKVGS